MEGIVTQVGVKLRRKYELGQRFVFTKGGGADCSGPAWPDGDRASLRSRMGRP